MKIMKTKQYRQLQFPARPLKVGGGFRFAVEYVIPEEKKAEVLRLLYPSASVPALDAVMLDLHAKKTFRVREFRVLRGNHADRLVSPYFPASGGTVADWADPAEN